MADVVVPLIEGINPDIGPPDPDIIRILENALERARRGEFSSIAMVGVLPHDNGIYRNWIIGYGQRVTLIGAAELLRAGLVERYFEVSYATEFDPVRDDLPPPEQPA